jgi:hypothetical protein
MRVLVACEFSGIVRDAFRSRGHDAVSCDLLPTEQPGPHIEGDVLDQDVAGFDLVIAHPPCRYLAVSGARWWAGRQTEQARALAFVAELMALPVARICVENPVSVIAQHIRPPEQTVQPWMFGHPEHKATCPWLQGLTTPQPAYPPFALRPHRYR